MIVLGVYFLILGGMRSRSYLSPNISSSFLFFNVDGDRCDDVVKSPAARCGYDINAVPRSDLNKRWNMSSVCCSVDRIFRVLSGKV